MVAVAVVVGVAGALSFARASLSTAPTSQKTWYWQNPTPQGDLLNGVATAGTSDVWAVGGPGIVLHSSDNGAVWEDQDPNTQDVLRAVDFTDAQHGWVVGDNSTVRVTSDGGSTWATQTVATAITARGVSMTTEQIGWIVGDGGEIRMTVNGGAEWTDATSGTGSTLNAVSAVDSSTAWAVGAAGTIVATKDRTTWATQTDPLAQTLNGVSFADTQTGYAVGDTGTVLKTGDGGTTWTALGVTYLDSTDTTVALTSDMRGVSFRNATDGWIVGAAGLVLFTQDGGLTWTSQQAGTLAFHGVAAGAGGTASIVGANGAMYGTSTEGASWISQSQGPTTRLNGASWTSPTSGVVVGAGGLVMDTVDAGNVWASRTLGSDDLYGVGFGGSTDGWIVGAGGTIKKTTDAGASWNDQSSGTTQTLYAVSAVTASTAWAVGDGGTVLITVDGGSTWTAQSSGLPATTVLYGVSAVDAQTVWAWGSAGTTIRTTNGGQTWVTMSTGSTADLYSGKFVDPQTGWVGGGSGTVLKTVDGGSTWATETTNAGGNTIRGIAFLDSLTGYLVGDAGTLCKTTDGGATWTAQLPGTSLNLNAVGFTDADHGWLVGAGGTILRTTDNTAPETTLVVAPSTPDGSNGWWTGQPQITLIPSESGITYYSWDSAAGPWSTFSVPVTPPVDGIWTLYYYSIDPGGAKETVKSTIGKVDSATPSTPGTPTASSPTTSTVAVSWPESADAASGVDYYQVVANGSVVGTSAAATTTIAGLSTETSYSISVRAVDMAGNISGQSASTQIITLAASPRPAVAAYARGVGSCGAFVDWGEATGTVGPVGYRVWRSAGGGAFSAIATITPGQSRSYVDAAAPFFSQLVYRISTVDGRGEGVLSDPTTYTSTITTGLPTPIGLVVRNTASVLVSWTPVPLPSVVGYDVYRATTSTGTPETQTVVPVPQPASGLASYHDTRTADYTEYWYRVATVDASGNVGVPSPPVYIRTEASATAGTPHGSYTEDSDFCAMCHSTHSSQSPTMLLQGTNTIDAPLCLSCHDGTSASDVLNEYTDNTRTSRHAVTVDTHTGTLVCSNCHGVHSAEQTDTVKGLLLAGDKKSGNAYCYTCHGATAGSSPRGDLRVFEGSVHATAVAPPASGTEVVCLSCHVAHSSREAAMFPYSGDDRCLGCHSTSATASGTVDVASRLSGPDSSTRHDLRSADSSATGSRLSCANCHEPHAASVTTPCVDPDNPTTSGGVATGVAFCLKCHDGSLPTSAETSGYAAAPLAASGSTATVDIAGAWATNFHGGGAASNPNLRPEMGYSKGDTMTCNACHDPHGSPNRFTLLDTVHSKTGTTTADGLLVVPLSGGGADLRFFCSSCHDVSALTHPAAGAGGADLNTFPLDCTAFGCHRHVGNGL